MERGWARMWRNKRVCVCVCVCVCACVYETHLSATLEVCVTSSNSVIMTKARGQEGVFCQKHIPLKDTLPHTHAQTHTHTHTHTHANTCTHTPMHKKHTHRTHTHTQTHTQTCVMFTEDYTIYDQGLSDLLVPRLHCYSITQFALNCSFAAEVFSDTLKCFF